MEISFFDSVLPSFRAVGVSKRRTQAATLVLRVIGRCVGLKRPCTGPCLEGRAKKDISMLSPLGSVTNSHWASASGQERCLFKELKCYKITVLFYGEKKTGVKADFKKDSSRCYLFKGAISHTPFFYPLPR